MDFQSFGKWLIVAGLLAVCAGAALTFLPKIPYAGRLPGDIYIKKEDLRFYFPLTTCLILSLLLNLLFKFFGKK